MRHVALSRSDSKPLGFTIAGGKGSRKGDIGIFVGHIHDNGAASQEGSMKVRYSTQMELYLVVPVPLPNGENSIQFYFRQVMRFWK